MGKNHLCLYTKNQQVKNLDITCTEVELEALYNWEGDLESYCKADPLGTKFCSRYYKSLSYERRRICTHLAAIAVKQDGLVLGYFVQTGSFEDKEIFKLAVAQNGLALRFIYEASLTPELCEIAVAQNEEAVKLIKPEMLFGEGFEKLIVKRYDFLKPIAQEILDYKDGNLTKGFVFKNILWDFTYDEPFLLEWKSLKLKNFIEWEGDILSYFRENKEDAEFCVFNCHEDLLRHPDFVEIVSEVAMRNGIDPESIEPPYWC